MGYAIAVLVALFASILIVGAISGRVKVRSCCSVPPEHDVRIKNALRDDAARAASNEALSSRDLEHT